MDRQPCQQNRRLSLLGKRKAELGSCRGAPWPAASSDVLGWCGRDLWAEIGGCRLLRLTATFSIDCEMSILGSSAPGYRRLRAACAARTKPDRRTRALGSATSPSIRDAVLWRQGRPFAFGLGRDSKLFYMWLISGPACTGTGGTRAERVKTDSGLTVCLDLYISI